MSTVHFSQDVLIHDFPRMLQQAWEKVTLSPCHRYQSKSQLSDLSKVPTPWTLTDLKLSRCTRPFHHIMILALLYHMNRLISATPLRSKS